MHFRSRHGRREGATNSCRRAPALLSFVLCSVPVHGARRFMTRCSYPLVCRVAGSLEKAEGIAESNPSFFRTETRNAKKHAASGTAPSKTQQRLPRNLHELHRETLCRCVHRVSFAFTCVTMESGVWCLMVQSSSQTHRSSCLRQAMHPNPPYRRSRGSSRSISLRESFEALPQRCFNYVIN